MYNLEENILYIIDRVEEGYGVLTAPDGRRANIPMACLPPEAGEGTALRYVGGRFEIDGEEAERRRERVHQLLEKLLNKNSGNENNNFDKNH